MSRAKHQFRPGALEVCETRIVPTVTPIPGIPFVPPGQEGHVDLSTHFTATGAIPGYTDTTYPNGQSIGFGINGDFIASKVTNADPVGSAPRYVTFVVYRAPGGGSGPSENLRSQKKIYEETTKVALAPGDTYTFYVDISKLDQTGPGVNGKHLTGADDLQCEDFDAGCDPNGYAPDKLNNGSALDGYIFAGELFNYDDSSPGNSNNNKKNK